MIDPAIIEQIIQAWEGHQNEPNTNRVKRTLPSVSVVQRFVEAAFFAGLRREEGRQLAFSAVLVSKTEATEHQEFEKSIHVLGQPIPFNASSIPKIVPAFDPRLSSLAVSLDESGELAVWGIFSFIPTSHRFNGVPITVLGWTFIHPDFLTVTAVAPGSLLFSRQWSAIGRIISGYFVRATPTPFTQFSLGKYWEAFLQRSPWGIDEVQHFLHASDALEILLGEIAARGHGGTLVVLDSSKGRPTDVYVPKYTFRNDHNLSELLKRCALISDPGTGIGGRKLAFEAIQRVAQLAAVDGALIIDSSFNVVAFGSTLTAKRWTRKTVVGPDGFGIQKGEDFEVSRYGTRHQSARDFAGACESALVFVISHDGPIRAFHKTDETTVTVWPDCSTSMFVS